MYKIAIAALLCALAGCSNTPRHGFPVCSTQPASAACQVDRYLAAP